MNSPTTPTLEKQGAAAILLSTGVAYVSMAVWGNLFPAAARCLILGAGVQSLLVFLGLARTLHRSDVLFYSIFVGDALLRFFILGLSFFVLNYYHIPLMMPLLCLASGYLFLSMIQIPFLHRMPLV